MKIILFSQRKEFVEKQEHKGRVGSTSQIYGPKSLVQPVHALRAKDLEDTVQPPPIVKASALRVQSLIIESCCDHIQRSDGN